MPTGYTREQIHQFEILVRTNTPPEQSAEQLKEAPVATGCVVAATDRDMLVNLDFEHGVTQPFFLNSVVANELVIGLMGAAGEQRWWTITELTETPAQDSRIPTAQELWDAFKVLSLRVDSTPDGVLVCFNSGRSIAQFFMPKSVAGTVTAGIQMIAGRAGWWDDEMRLVPSDG